MITLRQKLINSFRALGLSERESELAANAAPSINNRAVDSTSVSSSQSDRDFLASLLEPIRGGK